MNYKTLEIYTAPGCGDCAKLVAWMENNNIVPDKIIDKVEDVTQKARDLNDAGTKVNAVPFALIDGKVHAGLYSIRRRLT